jgi:pyruvate dehydrogenase E1 component
VAVIIQDGMRRMYEGQEDVYYYLTLLNENHRQPSMPAGVEEGIRRGLYLYRAGPASLGAPRVQLLGSGAIFHEVAAAADLLRDDWGVESDLWSVPSFTELAREGNAAARQTLFHPEANAIRSYVEEKLSDTKGPVVAATDYVRAYADQIRAFVPRRYLVLGTDGFGRSDTRERLRSFFEVDRFHVAVAALKALADDGVLPPARAAEAMQKYRIAGSRPAPWTV